MANPVEVVVAAGAWTKVATAVKTGMIRVLLRSARPMMQTYRLTGAAAPTNRSEGAVIPTKRRDLSIGSEVPIDVYLWMDGVAGNVRVDL